MDSSERGLGTELTRRGFCVSLGAGMTIMALPSVAGAALKKVPTSTGIDAVFVPFVVAAERKIFEKHGLETSYKPFDDGNVALGAVLTGSSDIGSTSELGGLARWDKGGRLYVTSVLDTSGKQIGITARETQTFLDRFQQSGAFERSILYLNQAEDPTIERLLAPRAGLAWDVHGDGRLAVRSSYSMGYDFMAGEYHNINAGAPPFGNRSLLTDPPGGMDNPWGHLPGGDPHPIVASPTAPYIPFGAFGSMDPDINSPRSQQWNLTIEQQLGDSWGVSAAYLGSYADRLWAQTALNPGVFLGLGPCTLNTADGPRSYPVCSTNGNLNQRRRLSLEDPIKSAQIGALDLNSDVGWQKYHGVKLDVRHRTATGLSLNGSYTLSRCKGTPTTNDFNQTSAGYSDPENPDLDAGYCDQDRRHLATLNAGYQTPEVGSGVVRALVSNWRASGILNARSGSRLNITSGRDNALIGSHNSVQRPNLVSDDIYGPGKDAKDLQPGQRIDNYFNRAAFAHAAPGQLGNAKRNLAVGPKFWQIDVALSKLVPFGTQRLELRFETFNLLNTFNWGPPVLSQGADRTHHNFNAGTFGRIISMAGTPRIMQFGVKFGF